MNISERELFEAWALKKGYDVERVYCDNFTQLAWESWQAALKTPSISLDYKMR